MSLTPAVELLIGRTAHSRRAPFTRSFSYGVTMIRLDIDRLDEAASASPLFGVNRGWAFGFHVKDHGERRRGALLRPWAEGQFRKAGVDASRGRIDLLTFPRVLGYGFAPISIWISHDRTGAPQGAIFEVHNTFGETHAYVGAFSNSNPHGEVDKTFFVSPFFDVSGGYRFTLSFEGGRLSLAIDNWRDGTLAHRATLDGTTAPLTTRNLMRQLIASPFSGHGVMAAILLEALRLWRKGARYHIRSVADDARTTVISAVAPAVAPEQVTRLIA